MSWDMKSEPEEAREAKRAGVAKLAGYTGEWSKENGGCSTRAACINVQPCHCLTIKLTDCRRRQRWSGKETLKPKKKIERKKRGGSSRAAHGWAASKDLALANWMQDMTSLLCYQPEVPHAHKESLVTSLDRYTHCSAQLAAGEPPND